MHDGSLKSLEEVVGFYDRSGQQNPWLSKASQPLHLTAGEQADLVAFLHALTGEIAAEVSSPQHCPNNGAEVRWWGMGC
jgi:cytochrome c peroxidase